jgi:hypothetical protein
MAVNYEYAQNQINNFNIWKIFADELIDINKNDFSNGAYKVRTKYSDSKFYLNKVVFNQVLLLKAQPT